MTGGTRRLNVLLTAYACEPGKGSDPGVGWNVAVGVAKTHDTWVLTRANNRVGIEGELARSPVPGLHFIYVDLPAWTRFWKRGQRGLHLYYYLWQLASVRVARRVHAEVGFDLVQHVTFVKYWIPSMAGASLGLPFLWGPVGGGETVPEGFREDYGVRGRAFELARDLGRWMGDHDPLVHRTARRSTLAIATTPNAAKRVARLGADEVRIMTEAALGGEDVDKLQALPPAPPAPFRFVSLGRLRHFKGFHLSIEAFARADLPGAEYWILGEGPERARLEHLCATLGVDDRVRFWGELPREEALGKLAECAVLVHPSLRESGGWVCLEGMAAGRPVVCLDLGGPAVQVSPEAGIRVPATSPEDTVDSMADAMRRLASHPEEVTAMGSAGRAHVHRHHEWSKKLEYLCELYDYVIAKQAEGQRVAVEEQG